MSANPLLLSGLPTGPLSASDGYLSAEEMVVMLAGLADFDYDLAIDRFPVKNVGRFVEAALEVGVLQPTVGAELTGVIEDIKTKAGLFIYELDDQPIATAICVHDEELAGLFEVACHESFRRRGFGRAIALTALKWGWMRGAERAWLQVGTENEAAIKLYERMGFSELYRYRADEVASD